jgi:magnesium transporter
MELHMTLTTDRTNEIIRILTIVSTILLPLNLIASFYGMNFQHMPELDSPWAYPFVICLMLIIAGGMIYLFRKRGWV